MIRVHCLPAYADGVVHSLIQQIADRLVEPLRERGIEWGCGLSDADLIWACQHQYAVCRDLPLIVQDVIDWASLNWMTRAAISEPHVRLVVKGTLFTDHALYNAPHFEDTRHGALLYELASAEERPAGAGPAPLSPQIADEALLKLRLGYNWLYEKRLWHLASLRPDDSHRDIDVSFIGTMQYARWHVGWHREQVVQRLEKLPGRNVIQRGRCLSTVEYDRVLCRTKVVVSPWGYGETCVRDLEALVAGCVLVKPETRFVMTWPEYHDEPHCLMFRPDLSDLETVVEQALDQWPALHAARMATQQRLVRMREADVFADRIAGLVFEALRSNSP